MSRARSRRDAEGRTPGGPTLFGFSASDRGEKADLSLFRSFRNRARTAVSRSSSSYLPALVTVDTRLARGAVTRGANAVVVGKAVREAAIFCDAKNNPMVVDSGVHLEPRRASDIPEILPRKTPACVGTYTDFRAPRRNKFASRRSPPSHVERRAPGASRADRHAAVLLRLLRRASHARLELRSQAAQRRVQAQGARTIRASREISPSVRARRRERLTTPHPSPPPSAGERPKLLPAVRGAARAARRRVGAGRWRRGGGVPRAGEPGAAEKPRGGARDRDDGVSPPARRVSRGAAPRRSRGHGVPPATAGPAGGLRRAETLLRDRCDGRARVF